MNETPAARGQRRPGLWVPRGLHYDRLCYVKHLKMPNYAVCPPLFWCRGRLTEGPWGLFQRLKHFPSFSLR